MLDSGANVMVIPWKEGMEGDHTMCALVGDNKTEGLVVARLATRQRTHLIVAVKGAKPLIPISYLIRIANYRATWRMMGEHDCFQMKDGYGDPVMVNEDEDLLYVGKTTLWRIGHDLYNSALHTTGMTWSDVWKTLTGEEGTDKEHLCNPGSDQCRLCGAIQPWNFTANKGELISGTVIDCKVNPQFDLTSSQVRQEVATLIEKEDPLFLIGVPRCTVFSSMQNINQKHNTGEAWEVKYQQGLSHLEYAVQLYWEQISRGRFFIHEHPATATSWGLPLIKELERHPGVQIVTGDMCRWGLTPEASLSSNLSQCRLWLSPGPKSGDAVHHLSCICGKLLSFTVCFLQHCPEVRVAVFPVKQRDSSLKKKCSRILSLRVLRYGHQERVWEPARGRGEGLNAGQFKMERQCTGDAH